MMQAFNANAPARLAVVIPCYNVEAHIVEVIRGVPPEVELIICVDDRSPDNFAARVRALDDPRVVLLRHEQNTGVGGAMITGIAECLRRQVDIVIKIDGDGQMDLAHLPRLIQPLLAGVADHAKGTRWHDVEALAAMPWKRRIGNLGLSFLTKMVSGYWKIFDPCNGYLATRTVALEKVPLDRLARDYFFETSLLVELGLLRAVVRDVPMPARYGAEVSSMRLFAILRSFPGRLGKALARRVWHRYFVRDFTLASIFLLTGAALFLGGGLFGSAAWLRSMITGVPATAGTVMLATLPFLMGFHLLLQALGYDISDEPREALCSGQPLGPPSPQTSQRRAA